jgi:hypothetical protein
LRETFNSCVLAADLDQMPRFPGTLAGDRQDSRQRLRRRSGAAIALSFVPLAVRIGLYVDAPGTRPFHRFSEPSCSPHGIEGHEGAEGICAAYEEGRTVVHNIVDRARVLHMPEYDAKLVAVSVTNTRVGNWRSHADLYPDGRGTLLSFEVEITNPGSTPLQIGALTVRSPIPAYKPDPPAQVQLPTSPGSGEVIPYPALYNARRTPTPPLFGQPPILPRASLTGWVSMVTPANTLTLMNASGADLQLAPLDGNPDYVGIIRLWK